MSVTQQDWQLKLLFDGLCPVCAWEMRLLKRRDRAGVLRFEDIADPAFDPHQYGLTLDDVVGAMHAVRPDGSVMQGVEVFAVAYRLIGATWKAAVLECKPLRPLLNLGYRLFARIRPRLSSFEPCTAGRCRVGGA